MYIFLYRKYMVKNLEEHIRDQVCEMLNEEKVIDDFRALARLLKYKESEIEEIGLNDRISEADEKTRCHWSLETNVSVITAILNY